MDFSVIDELYEIYQNEDIAYAEEMFGNYYKNNEKHGRGYLINLLKEYVKQQTPFVANYFVSNKDEAFEDHTLIRDFVTAFENQIMAVDYLLVDVLKKDEMAYDGVVSDTPSKMLRPHDLFNMKTEFLDEAVSKYGECYIDDYKKIKDLIVYVKKNKILSKLYKDNSWYDMDFEELMYNLYDYIEDKSVFKKDAAPTGHLEFFLFEKIKENCRNMLKGSFDKFRPSLNSTKQIRADFAKLIFCKNLLMYFETGIMPSYDGFIDFSVDSYEHIEMMDNFNKLYSKRFDEISFRENQGNFICNPEVYSQNYALEGKKRVRIGNKLLCGFIVSCSDDLGYTKNDYLIHIQINDVANSCSTYEMQISIVPHGDFEHRLQLMRLDNWESEQSHRNIAKKLATRTHIHLYNEFDLLRGKTNGAFDIAYNVEGRHTTFEDSLKTFLRILDLDQDITKVIYASTIKALNDSKKAISEK